MLFGESTSAAEANVLLHTAAELGINFFDSAEMYPVPQSESTQGLSEVILGRWLRTQRRYQGSLPPVHPGKCLKTAVPAPSYFSVTSPMGGALHSEQRIVIISPQPSDHAGRTLLLPQRFRGLATCPG